jgi:hypothetical protein
MNTPTADPTQAPNPTAPVLRDHTVAASRGMSTPAFDFVEGLGEPPD